MSTLRSDSRNNDDAPIDQAIVRQAARWMARLWSDDAFCASVQQEAEAAVRRVRSQIVLRPTWHAALDAALRTHPHE